MGESLQLDYYYGIEAEQFSFYRVPRLLIKDERYRGLSSDAKLLYGLMLDRMSLSMKNGWMDDMNRAYIIYTIDNIMEDLGCSKPTCIKIIKELDSDSGIGLIEKVRRGLGKPDIIYVKNFSTIAEAQEGKKPENADKSTEVKNLYFKKEKNFTSGSKEIEPQEVKKFAPNYTNYNQTEVSYTNPINQSATEKSQDDVIGAMDDAQSYINLIKENIDYDHHMKYDDYGKCELYDELFQVICEVVCVNHKSVRIAGEDYPYELVKSRFLKLNGSHLEYVIGCMQNTTTKITNIKAYMITALYNAPSTINHFYQQEVQHDMYGGGWHEKGIV